MKTAVRRVLLLSALMSPGALYALGLGEIRLNSALNQPFDAEIDLVSATQEDLGALRAALASNDTFARYGLDRPAYLSEFSFRVTKGPGGRDVLRVTSPRPVTEPFVTLLVEANWPRGRLLREYTVLLDPPVYAPGPAAAEPVATPQVSSGGAASVRPAEAAEPVGESRPAPAPAPAVRAAAPVAGVAAGSTYRVRRNDTLWGIASQVSPGTRSDVNRAMVSIFQNNPQAFDGNINVLRAGSTLRIPETSEIASMSASAAAAEVARQYDAWRGGAATSQATATPADEAGRLRLVIPDEGTAAPSTTAASAPPAKAGTALGTTSPATTAPGTTAPAQAADIEARVQQLEAELAEARRLLEVRNAELATLQGGAAAPESPAAEQPAAETEPAAKPVTPAPAATPEGPTLLQRVQDYWWVLVALLAAGLGFLLFRRMRRERGVAEDNLEEALGKDLRAAPRYAPRREPEILVEEKRPVEPARAVQSGTVAASVAAAAAAVAPAPRPVEPPRRPASVDDTMSGEGPASTESSDPLAEADFHMAYGLYDQAADLVQLAIKREPGRRELRLKLLEIFFVWGNRDRFLEQARELHASRAQAPAGEWDKVLIMGKQIAPEEPMFAATPSAAGDSLDMELHGATATLDIDMSGMRAITTPDIDLTEKEADLTESSGLDFVFDEPGATSVDSQVAPTVETPMVRGESRTSSDTQEITVADLGLDVDALRELDALESEGDTVNEMSPALDDTVNERVSAADDTVNQRAQQIDDTVEAPRAGLGGAASPDEEADLLSATSLMNALDDSTMLVEAEPGMIDLSDATGVVSQLDATALTAGVDFDPGLEPPTMSEVGTKLDLARAYMDMGDPEGARSILDEVLQEGSTTQKQEAERLIASLP